MRSLLNDRSFKRAGGLSTLSTLPSRRKSANDLKVAIKNMRTHNQTPGPRTRGGKQTKNHNQLNFKRTERKVVSS